MSYDKPQRQEFSSMTREFLGRTRSFQKSKEQNYCNSVFLIPSPNLLFFPYSLSASKPGLQDAPTVLSIVISTYMYLFLLIDSKPFHTSCYSVSSHHYLSSLQQPKTTIPTSSFTFSQIHSPIAPFLSSTQSDSRHHHLFTSVSQIASPKMY